MASPCVKIIVEKARERGEKLSDARAAETLAKIHNWAKAIADKKYGGMYERGVEEAAGRHLDEVAFRKAAAVQDELVHIKALRQTRAVAMRHLEAGGLIGDGMEAALNSSSKKIKGAGISMDGVARNRTQKLIGRYTTLLDRDGLTRIDASGELDKEIWTELWNMSQPVPVEGASGSPEALKIAKARMEVRRQSRHMAALAGDINKDRPGFANPQTWSQERLMEISKDENGNQNSNIGYEKWKAIVLPHIDELETFRGESPERWLRSFWDNIYTQNYTSGSGANRAESSIGMMSRQRKMVFNSAEGSWEINKAFGENASREGFLIDIQRAAEHSARLEYLGGRPEKMWKELSNEMSELAKTMPDAQKQEASIQSESLRIAFNLASGANDNPGNVKWAKGLATAQGALVLATQGGTLISATTGDVVTMHMQATRFGFSAVDQYVRTLVELFTPSHDDVGNNFLKHLGIGNEAALGLNATRFQQSERAGQAMMKATELMFKANGVTWWTRATRRAVAGNILSTLGDLASLTFDQLGAKHRMLMDKYNIDSHMWEALRNTKGEVGKLGSILTGSITGEMDPALVRTLKDKYGAGWRDRVEERLALLVSGEVHNAVIEAGARERKWTTLGTRSGTFSGNAVRMLMFMKSFPIAMVTKQLAEEVAYGNKARFLGYAAASTVLGYMSILVRDTLAGKKPRPFTNHDDSIQWSLLKDSIQRGGFLGVFGDIGLQEYDRGFRDFSSYIAGPMASKVFDPVLAGVNKAVRGESFRGEIADLGGLIPFNNLIWSKAVIDHTFGAELKEAVNPGAIQKLKESARRNYNQEYYDWSGPGKH